MIFIVFDNSDILNPEILTHIESFGTGIQAIGGAFNNLLTQPNLIVMIVILIVLIWEIVEVVIKTFQAKRA